MEEKIDLIIAPVTNTSTPVANHNYCLTRLFLCVFLSMLLGFYIYKYTLVATVTQTEINILDLYISIKPLLINIMQTKREILIMEFNRLHPDNIYYIHDNVIYYCNLLFCLFRPDYCKIGFEFNSDDYLLMQENYVLYIKNTNISFVLLILELLFQSKLQEEFVIVLLNLNLDDTLNVYLKMLYNIKEI